MASKPSYNLRSPAVKRLMREAAELHQATEQYYAQPLEDNIFEWHFTVRGPPDTDFADGRYHGRILLPPEYPMKPPSIILLTPNGRFEVGKKICLSMSAHHPETWQPSWSIRTVLLAIIGFMPSKGDGAIGALEYRSEERKKLAKKSFGWVCSSCGSDNRTCLIEGNKSVNTDETSEALEIASQINFKSSPEDASAASVKNKTESANEKDYGNESQKTDVVSEDVESIGSIEIDIEKERDNIANFGAVGDDQTATADVDTDAEQAAQSVRKRTAKIKNSENTTENVTKRDTDTVKKKENGIFSLVLLWIVVLLLIVLIFRRLCMDIMVIDGTK